MDARITNYLLEGAVLFDLTGFFADPMRTGVQRTVYELFRNWPNQGLTPVIFHPDGRVRVLPHYTLEEMALFFDKPSSQVKRAVEKGGGAHVSAEAVARLEIYVATQGVLLPTGDALEACRAVLAAEIFFDHRVPTFGDFIESNQSKFFLLGHDLLPFLRPEYFPALDWADAGALLGYLHIVRRAENIAGVSHATVAELRRARRRKPDDDIRVFPLGADAFGRRRSRPAPAEPTFVILGSVEPRKTPVETLVALDRVASEGKAFRVLLIGRRRTLVPDQQATMEHILNRASWLEWREGMTDSEVSTAIANATAGICLSAVEGFGLAPLECLNLGVPVIVSADVPSLRFIGPEGQIRLDSRSPEAIASAVERLLDQAEAGRLRDDASRCALPLWSTFARDMAGWIDEIIGPAEESSDFWARVKRLKFASEAKNAPMEWASAMLFEAVVGREPTLIDYDRIKGILDEPNCDRATIALSIAIVLGSGPRAPFPIIDAILRSEIAVDFPTLPDRVAPPDERVHELLLSLYSAPSGDEFAQRLCLELFNRLPEEADMARILRPELSKIDAIVAEVSSEAFQSLRNKPCDPDILWSFLLQDIERDDYLAPLLAMQGKQLINEGYRRILGRVPDVVGFRNWSAALASRRLGGKDMILVLSSSEEYLYKDPDARLTSRALARVKFGTGALADAAVLENALGSAV